MDSAFSQAKRDLLANPEDASLVVKYLNLGLRTQNPIELSWIKIWDPNVQEHLKLFPSDLIHIFGRDLPFLNLCFFIPLMRQTEHSVEDNEWSDVDSELQVLWQPMDQVIIYGLKVTQRGLTSVTVRYETRDHRVPQETVLEIDWHHYAIQELRTLLAEQQGYSPEEIRVLDWEVGETKQIQTPFYHSFVYQPQDWLGPSRWSSQPDYPAAVSDNPKYLLGTINLKQLLKDNKEQHQNLCSEVQEASDRFWFGASYTDLEVDDRLPRLPREIDLDLLPAISEGWEQTQTHQKSSSRFNKFLKTSQKAREFFQNHRLITIAYQPGKIRVWQLSGGDWPAPMANWPIFPAVASLLFIMRDLGLTKIPVWVALEQPTRVLPT